MGYKIDVKPLGNIKIAAAAGNVDCSVFMLANIPARQLGHSV